MTIEELYEKQHKEILDKLMHMHKPQNNEISMIKYIMEQGEFFKEIAYFNYGRMMGIKSEREKRKWNAMACFYNMKAYVACHNGELPDSYNLLMQWARHHDQD